MHKVLISIKVWFHLYLLPRSITKFTVKLLNNSTCKTPKKQPPTHAYFKRNKINLEGRRHHLRRSQHLVDHRPVKIKPRIKSKKSAPINNKITIPKVFKAKVT